MEGPEDMEKPYTFPCDKLRPCPAASAGDTPQPVVVAVCGAFNPLHRAHIAIFEAARCALEKAGRPVLGGYFSPVGDAYGKPGLLAAWKRVAVANAVVEAHPYLMVDTWEPRQPAYTRTVRVLDHIQECVDAHYHDSAHRVSVVLACGEDMYKSFFIPGVWPLDLLKKLLDSFQLVVIAREDLPNMHVDASGTVLTGRTSDGENTTLDIAAYNIIRTTFAVPDNTSSSDVRAALESSPDETTAIAKIAPLVGDTKAAMLVCRYYGNFASSY